MNSSFTEVDISRPRDAWKGAAARKGNQAVWRKKGPLIQRPARSQGIIACWHALYTVRKNGMKNCLGERLSREGGLGDGVVPMSAPRVAAQDPPDAQPASLEDAMLLDGLQGVLGAGGHKAAGCREKGGNGSLVDPDQKDKDSFQSIRSFVTSGEVLVPAPIGCGQRSAHGGAGTLLRERGFAHYVAAGAAVGAC